MAAEASAAAREKKDKTTAKREPAKPAERAPRRSSRAPVAMKIVWRVLNATGREVAVFPYPERAAADAQALKLTNKSGVVHFVEAGKVPLHED
jgi:hypothetical protein